MGGRLALSPPQPRERQPCSNDWVSGRPYVLSVSHFYVYQNLIELVGGFARALPTLPREMSLVLAGPEIERGYAARVHDLVRSLRLSDRVRFVGPVPYADLPAVYAAAALFAFATTCESFPNTLIEAMSAGVPTLAARIGPMPELGGEGARYFEPDSSADIGRVLQAIWRDEASRSGPLRRRSTPGGAVFMDFHRPRAPHDPRTSRRSPWHLESRAASPRAPARQLDSS